MLGFGNQGTNKKRLQTLKLLRTHIIGRPHQFFIPWLQRLNNEIRARSARYTRLMDYWSYPTYRTQICRESHINSWPARSQVCLGFYYPSNCGWGKHIAAAVAHKWSEANGPQGRPGWWGRRPIDSLCVIVEKEEVLNHRRLLMWDGSGSRHSTQHPKASQLSL